MYFEEERVLHMGDLYFNEMYPNIDLEAGGSVQAWSATLDSAMTLPATIVIPGHGALSNKQGMRVFQAFMEDWPRSDGKPPLLERAWKTRCGMPI